MYSDGFSRSFMELGQDGYEIIADFEILQKQWARENGIDYDTEGNMLQRGCFQLINSGAGLGQYQCHFLLSVPGRRCEVLCREYQLKATLYHCQSASQALRLFLHQAE